jgi:lipoprotein-releasing system permease protein
MKGRAWIFFVARRWFAAKRESGGAASSLLAAAGIAIGVAALIVILGVMNGFQMGFVDAILEVSSFHVRISENRPGRADEDVLARLRSETGIRSVLPFIETRCLLVAPDGRIHPMALRVLPREASRLDPDLSPALHMNSPLFEGGGESRAGSDGEVELVIGSEIGRYLGLEAGDAAGLLTISAGGAEGVETRNVAVRIGALFKSGYFEYDYGLAYAPSDEVGLLFPPEANLFYTYGIKLEDRFADAELAGRLSSMYGLGQDRVQTWREYNRAFFGALRTEKAVMLLLVGLIFLVVGVNIYHAMRRTVAERMEEIAVLRAGGADSEELRFAFVLDGLAVGGGGALFGTVTGLLLAVNVNEVLAAAEAVMNGLAALVSALGGRGGVEDYRVFSPQYFYLMEVPVRVVFGETLFVAAIAIASAALAASVASRQVASLAPAEVLRYE